MARRVDKPGASSPRSGESEQAGGAEAETKAQAAVRRSVYNLNNVNISRANSIMAPGDEHPVFGEGVEKADLKDLEELEERSLTLIEGRRLTATNMSDDFANAASTSASASNAPAGRSLRDYSIAERKSIREPGMPRKQRLSEYTARVAGHGSIMANAALLIENTLSDRHMKVHSENMAWMPIVKECIFRFDESDAARIKAPPSLCFENPKLRNQRIDTSSFEKKFPAFLPSFQGDDGQQEVIFSLPLGTTFYGTGEVGGSVERTGKRIYNWNTDAWGYNRNTTSLYQSHPWVFSVLANGESFGVLADTSLRCEIDLRIETTVRFVAVAPYPVITFGPYPNPEALMVAFASVIGTIELPPKWALGYHQCRWSYETAEKVSKIAHTFREKMMPCDVVWMDIDYMQAFKCFTFNKETFPDVRALCNELHNIGFKGIWILDPGIKVEDGYEPYKSGSGGDLWIQSQNKTPYIGECWPGPVVFPDFTNKKARKWWSKLVAKFTIIGVDGIWNDMNEPAVFKTVSKTMPETNIHRGDKDLGGVQPHSYYHNVYGMLQAKATFEGMLLANKDKRPFVLTRAGFVGSQRYAATWTGDNLSTWEHLGMSIPMALNLGLSGQPFSGPDIGGFAGDVTPRMFARWMGIGAMLPFSRGHAEKGTNDQEPWAFGPQVEEVCRFALNRRYRLLPHLYTLFYQAHKRGVPVMTPLFFADPTDSSLRQRDDGFLLGSILVSACTTPKHPENTLEVLLPKGIWQRFHFEDDSPELPLLFLKGGGIVPTGPVVQCTGEFKPSETVTLLIALDDTGKAKGVMYEDDGDGFGYKHDKYLLTFYEAQQLPRANEDQAAEIVIKVARHEGHWPRPNRKLHIRLLLGNSVQVEGECKDGEELKMHIPSPAEINELVAKKRILEIAERERTLASLDEVLTDRPSAKGAGGASLPIDLSAGNMTLKVVPWIGGRIVSMIHMLSGIEWLEGRFESGCYEEYSGHEFRSAGCTEEYQVVKHSLESMDGEEFLGLVGDVGGGLIMSRDILVAKDSPDKVNITSRIEASSDGNGDGSDGTSRLARLRVHPTLKLVRPLASVIRYTSISGREYVQEPNIEFKEISIEGTDRPNGMWRLEDNETGMALINRFDVNQVSVCLISWGPASVSLELWSEERPVSAERPIIISHEYEFIDSYAP